MNGMNHTASNVRHQPSFAIAELGAVLLSLLGTGCSGDVPPAPGELLLLLSSDMQTPDSFDTLILDVGNGIKQRYTAPGTPATQDPEPGCSTDLAPRSKQLALPTTIALLSHSEQPTKVAVTLRACKTGRQVFERTFKTQIPESGQIRMLRTPLRWLCSDWEGRCYGCGDPDQSDTATDLNSSQSAESNVRCAHREISLLETPDACETSACMVNSPEQFESIEYVAEEAAKFVPDSKPDTTTCLNPWTCFAMGRESQFYTVPDVATASDSQASSNAWAQLPTSWNHTDGETRCLAMRKVTEEAEPIEDFNVALVLPPGSKGFCDPLRCLVHLDANDAVGWKWQGANHQTIELPNSVCHMLDSGQILYVAGSLSCPSKTTTVPLCGGTKDEFDRPQSLHVPTSAHLTFDEPCSAGQTYTDTQKQVSLYCVQDTRIGTSTIRPEMFSPIAVRVGAARFNTLQYARMNNTKAISESRSLSGWVSLEAEPENSTPTPEGTVVDTSVMPVVSNVAANCSSGIRLELRTCRKNSDVIVALGIPSGQESEQTCPMSYRYAQLAAKGTAGGYSSPWQAGNWYHIAAVYPSRSDARIYVNGREAAPATVDSDCPLVASELQPTDGDQTFIGSQPALASRYAAASRDQPWRVSPTLLVDELTFHPEALSRDDVRRMMLETSTEIATSGLRWGGWGTQGSYSNLKHNGDASWFEVQDEPFSSAGGYALLVDPEDLQASSPQHLTENPTQDLTEFDQAVLVADLPPHRLFQFAVVSDNGRRQCTWQLATGTTEGRSTHVIDLNRPSWCVDPKCGFDRASVDRITIGTDWKATQGSVNIAPIALAFRKRSISAEGEHSLGGIEGPGGLCWRPVAYDPQWVVEPALTAAALISSATQPAVTVRTPQAFASYAQPDPYGEHEKQVPEFAADFMDDSGPRDFSNCASVRLCLELGRSTIENAESAFVLQNDRGQTAWWSMRNSATEASSCSHWVDISAQHTGIWPNGADVDAIRGSVTRLSIRYSGQVTVQSAECCNADASRCDDIGILPGLWTSP